MFAWVNGCQIFVFSPGAHEALPDGGWSVHQIHKTARQAQWRLWIHRFLGFLPWTLTGGMVVAAIGLALQKLVYIPVDPVLWMASWIGCSMIVAVITTACLTLVGRPTRADAAVELDRRFNLRERLSSALILTDEDRQSELGRALLADAEKRAGALDVAAQFPWGFRRSLLIPLVPALLAALLWYLPDRPPAEVAQSPGTTDITHVKNSTQPLMEQIKKKRELAEEEGLTAAVDMFKKLEGELAKLQKNTKLDSKQTLAKLNDIRSQLEERRKELGSAESLRKNLQNLEKFDAGPAEKLGEALKKGDFEKAEESLDELLKKMQAGKMSAKDMQQLQRQLQKLEQAMSEAGQAHEQAKQALQEQIAQAEAAGNMQKAAELEKKLGQLQAQDANLAQMQQMADMLSQAQQAMEQGDLQSAQQTLQEMASQLQQMNQSDRELQDLDELMDSLAQSKSQMMCQECSGMGCSSCMGQMPGQFPGNGMGEGQGLGDRPEEETDTDFFDSRVRDRMKQGETIYGGPVGGDNRKGTTLVEVQDAVLTSLSEEPEALDDTPLPRTRRDHTREYFNSFRESQ